MDLVSIVIPCYNHEKYLQSCLQSIIDQTYQNIELLVCDDNSTDSSFKILKEYEPVLKKRFDRVVINKNEENMGVCKTLNKLIKQCKGLYIKTIASDDMLRFSAINDYVEFMRHNKCDIVFANLYKINEHYKYPVKEEETLSTYYSQAPVITDSLTRQLCSGNFISGASQFFSRNTFEKFGYYDERFCLEDWEFSLRVSKCGNIMYMDRVTMYYRIMEGTLSHYGTDEKSVLKHRKFYHDKLSILKEYESYCNNENKSDFFSQAIRETIILNDKELIKEICDELKKNEIKVAYSSKIRLILFQIGLYGLIRKVKVILRKRLSNASD